MQLFVSQRLRTALAMLGVFLGALMLTLIAHILGSVGLLLENEAKSMGSHIATVTAGRPVFSRERDMSVKGTGLEAETEALATAKGTGTNSTSLAATLTAKQLEEALESIPFITTATAFVTLEGQVGSERRSSSCQIMGVTPVYFSLRQAKLASGRLFNPDEEERKALVCTLGHALAERLFGDARVAVGKYIRLERSQVQVTGVMQAKGADSSGTNMDEYVFLPLGTAMQRFSTRDHVSGFYVGMETRDVIPQLEQTLSTLLRERHRLASWQRDDFTISFAGQVDEMVTNALALITTLGFIGASISFGVGSLGVFSIMILMVHARKNEIGIRRAVGASRRSILRQFLWEAALMAGGGGMMGVFTALVLVWAISLTGLLPSYINLSLSMGVCLLSLFCGLLAGGYPAWKASRLSVIKALRT